MRPRTGFTLPELLVVILIVGLVSVVALPAALSALGERDVIAGATQLQAALVGARDAAIHSNAPAGIRLLPDPALPNTCNRWIAIETPASYSEGRVNTFPGFLYDPVTTDSRPCLVIEESPIDHWMQNVNGQWIPLPNPQVNWAYNVRVGDRVIIGTQKSYTVIGPVSTANQDGFVNTTNPLTRVYTASDGVTTVSLTPEYLLLVNGVDDNRNGFVDDGFDGIDNDQNGIVDDLPEWEAEQWNGPQVSNAPYVIARRPAPLASGVAISLPSGCVIDLTDRTRSRLPVSPDGSVDIMVNPNGTLAPPQFYSAPTSQGLGSEFLQFWVADRADVGLPAKGNARLITLNGRTGRIATFDPSGSANPRLEAIR